MQTMRANVFRAANDMQIEEVPRLCQEEDVRLYGRGTPSRIGSPSSLRRSYARNTGNVALCSCMTPFITSQFMPRVKGDRPMVRPVETTNIAFIGQYCEIPGDVVFTVEYSVRSAQIAVFSLLNIDKEVSPLYKAQFDVPL